MPAMIKAAEQRVKNEVRQNEEKMQLKNRKQLFYGDYVQLYAQPWAP